MHLLTPPLSLSTHTHTGGGGQGVLGGGGGEMREGRWLPLPVSGSGCFLIPGSTRPSRDPGTSTRCGVRNHLLRWGRAQSRAGGQRQMKLSTVPMYMPRSNTRRGDSESVAMMHKRTQGRRKPGGGRRKTTANSVTIRHLRSA